MRRSLDPLIQNSLQKYCFFLTYANYFTLFCKKVEKIANYFTFAPRTSYICPSYIRYNLPSLRTFLLTADG